MVYVDNVIYQYVCGFVNDGFYVLEHCEIRMGFCKGDFCYVWDWKFNPQEYY